MRKYTTFTRWDPGPRVGTLTNEIVEHRKLSHHVVQPKCEVLHGLAVLNATNSELTEKLLHLHGVLPHAAIADAHGGDGFHASFAVSLSAITDAISKETAVRSASRVNMSSCGLTSTPNP